MHDDDDGGYETKSFLNTFATMDPKPEPCFAASRGCVVEPFVGYGSLFLALVVPNTATNLQYC